jgi:hypothetical protein
MKKSILTILTVFICTMGFAQAAKPNTNSKLPTTTGVSPKDTTVYLTPVDMSYDTVLVYGIVVDVKTPLGVSMYQVITKNWVYENGTKKQGDQWLETGAGVKINDWKRRLIWVTAVADWKE